MYTKKSLLVLFSMFVILALVLGTAIQASAETTLHYKVYTWVNKGEKVPVGDVEGHMLGFVMRSAFLAFDNGEVATANSVGTNDYVKGEGPFMQYVTFKFQDGATIMVKTHGTMGAGAAGWTSEIIKGTGRFEGITGTQDSKVKYLPLEPGEPFAKGYGEGTIIYTLPSK